MSTSSCAASRCRAAWPERRAWARHRETMDRRGRRFRDRAAIARRFYAWTSCWRRPIPISPCRRAKRASFRASQICGCHVCRRSQSRARRSNMSAGLTARQSGGRLICDEIAPAAEMDGALARVVEGLTSAGAVSAIGNRRAFRVGQGAARPLPPLRFRLCARTGLLPLQPGADREFGAQLARAESEDMRGLAVIASGAKQ